GPAFGFGIMRLQVLSELSKGKGLHHDLGPDKGPLGDRLVFCYAGADSIAVVSMTPVGIDGGQALA
ncbi:MAG TPA: hypothetical protein DCE41_34005, partial [Cytophagales bacterium]|nr:hypothetical protein [Cytophagales bacterium]